MSSWFADWPRWLRILLTLVGLSVFLFLILGIGSDKDLDLWGAKFTHRETPKERFCRTKREDLSAREQRLDKLLSQHGTRLASIDQHMREVQRSCLAEVSQRPAADQRGCLISPRARHSLSIMGFDSNAPPPPPPGASGYYQSVLREAAVTRTTIEAEAKPLTDEGEHLLQERRLLDQQCSAE